jgi:transcriptional regulator with PAS, ATPase and Fis domain
MATSPTLRVRTVTWQLVQHGEIEKVGATQPAQVDVRIIAATHRDLKAMIEVGTFREDLYYR